MEVGNPWNRFAEDGSADLDSMFSTPWSHTGTEGDHFDGLFVSRDSIDVESRAQGWALTAAQVPEPSTTACIVAGALALALRFAGRRPNPRRYGAPMRRSRRRALWRRIVAARWANPER